MFCTADLTRLEDPEFIARLQERKRAHELAIEEQHKPVDEAIAYCRERPDQMTTREALFLRSLYWRRQVYEPIGKSQQAWLLRIQARMKATTPPAGRPAAPRPPPAKPSPSSPPWCPLT